MSQRITYYYAVASGFAYLGEPELRRVAALAGADIDYRPIDIQRIFRESGTTPPPRQSETRRAYRDIELARWGRVRDLPIHVRPAFWPVEVEPASRLVIAAQELGLDAGRFSFALLRAVWAESRNIADPETIRAIAGEVAPAGQAEAVLAKAADESTAQTYQRTSDDAVAAGVFGSPTYIVDGEFFFGQDRLSFLGKALGLND